MDTEQLIRDVVKNVLQKLNNDAPSSPENATRPEPAESAVNSANPKDRKIVSGVSVRHVHLCRKHLDILFGRGYNLSVLRELYNPGYACKEALTLVGPKLSTIQNVRILGPLRDRSQVELAKTDCIILGIDAPVRASGDLEGSSSCVLVGPNGAVYLDEGVIRANRHLHMSPDDASYFNLSDNDEVDVRTGGPKGLTFNNVQVRVSEKFKTELHIDTDDANAADIVNGSLVDIVDASCIMPIQQQVAAADRTPPAIPDGSFVGQIEDPAVLNNVCTILTGKSCTKDQLSDTAEAIAAAAKKAKKDKEMEPSAGTPGKTVITVSDLDDYLDSGISVDDSVILTPLARDEAKSRGIRITYNNQ